MQISGIFLGNEYIVLIITAIKAVIIEGYYRTISGNVMVYFSATLS